MSHFDIAVSIIERLQSQGFTAYFAGGWVRDFLMDHPSHDIDIVTNASTDTLQKLFPKTIPVGIQFGIIIVVENSHHFEVATFRKDLAYIDGRRPSDVETQASPQEDAQRRDFTVNGIFYDPITQTLFDYVNGQADIKEKVIRAIGNPNQRFLEDRLRMIRAVRYANRFYFTIDPDTQQAIINHAQYLFPSVAIERIWQELTKMALYKSFGHAIITLYKLKLLEYIFPHISIPNLKTLTERTTHFPLFPDDTPVIFYLLYLFQEFSLEDKLSLCKYLKLSKKDTDTTHTYHRLVSIFLDNSSQDLYIWSHIYADPLYHICVDIASFYLPEQSRSLFLHSHAARYQSLLKPFIKNIQAKTPLITSQDLITQGIPPGPKLGALLEKSERITINNQLTTKESVLKHLFNEN